MIGTSDHRLKSWPRVQVMAVIVMLVVVACALLGGAEPAIAQLRLRKLIGNAEALENGWLQPQARRVQKQFPPVRKLDPNPGKKPNQNPQRPANLRDDFTDEERSWVPVGMGRSPAITRSLRQLNLSDEQKTKLRNLTRQIGNQVQLLNRLHRTQSDLWEEALYAHDFDPKLIERRATDLANAQAELFKLNISIMAQIRQILTPEQAMRFRELLDEERRGQNQQPLPAPTPIR